MNEFVINLNEVLNVDEGSGMGNLFLVACKFLEYVFQKGR